MSSTEGAFRPTIRQTEILRLVSSGLADKEIAAELGISVKTVRTHLDRLFRGIGASGRAHAVALWLAHERDTDDDPARTPRPVTVGLERPGALAQDVGSRKGEEDPVWRPC